MIRVTLGSLQAIASNDKQNPVLQFLEMNQMGLNPLLALYSSIAVLAYTTTSIPQVQSVSYSITLMPLINIDDFNSNLLPEIMRYFPF